MGRAPLLPRAAGKLAMAIGTATLLSVQLAAVAARRPHVNLTRGKPAPPLVSRAATSIPAPFYTGLIIDASDLHYEPRMSPKIYDDADHNILEGLTFDPDAVVAQGLAGWVRSAPGPHWPRSGDHPLVVKAIRADGDRLIVQQADGQTIRQADVHDHFLEDLKVMILY
ncbi:MAG: hypothetical protein KGR26_11170 [Cyanobacteria bacterium REEB65]|nr:hypothetical protein [Cyanobacteria bacterium REEB65]